ncbi:hypothetical protein ACTNDN_19575 [Niallia sp. HCP3S3_B10]|uniref:Uncharacterized protein n=1 Tax=Niallia hominis TaxID=3133173 RepID=A0ABV1F094_9BACI
MYMEKLKSLLPVFILLLSTVFVSPASAANKLQVHLINVGQGDSTILFSMEGIAMEVMLQQGLKDMETRHDYRAWED